MAMKVSVRATSATAACASPRRPVKANAIAGGTDITSFRRVSASESVIAWTP